MASPFETAILKMQQLGLFKFFFPFLLTAAIFYGGLRKSQIFGDPEKNISVNAVIALVASLFVWATPIILGIDIEKQLAAFFIQGIGVTLGMMIALIVAGMFLPPDLPKSLGEKLKGGWFWGAVIIGAIIVGIVLLISSGLYKVLFPSGFGGFGFSISSDTLITFGVIILMIVVVVVIVKGGGGK